MKGSSSRNLKIEHQCPQCGGPVILEETDRLFTCLYCRVKLCITSKEYFRYYFSPKAPSSEEILFIPYWRFRGMFFSVKPFEIKNKVLDTNFQSTDYSFLPRSLGLRTQTLKLRFATSEMQANFLSPRISLGQAISMAENLAHVIEAQVASKHIFESAFIGDTASMIYSPVYVKGNSLYDGILNRPCAQFTKAREEKLHASITQLKSKIMFLSALCPDCGWDLSGERNSLVLLCKNCGTAWETLKGSLKKLKFSIVPWKDKNVFYIPFWRMNVTFDGVNLNSYADLIKFANLPKAIQKGWEEKKLHFWCPAFKVHPAMFMRLAKQMTMFQPQEECNGSIPKSNFSPVTLDVNEAFEGIKIICATMSVAKRKLFPLLPGIKTHLEGSLLVYFPFTIRGSEFIQTQMKFSIQRNSVRN